MTDEISPDPNDPFGPPAIPTLVGCLHCGEEYESYLIEWRVRRSLDGEMRGFWCCPTPGCDGIGFGFDILPVDEDYEDENGKIWIGDDDEDEDEEDGEYDPFADDDDEGGTIDRKPNPDNRPPF
jgi:hypothetical protein